MECRRHHGLMLLDALAGLTLLVALATLVAVMVGKTNTQTRTLADRRAAMVMAETVLTDLQLGRRGEWAKQLGDAVHIEPLLTDGRPPAAGKLWVRIEIQHHGQTASLIGVAPDEAPGNPRGTKP
jgi:hypothetical protein